MLHPIKLNNQLESFTSVIRTNEKSLASQRLPDTLIMNPVCNFGENHFQIFI